LALGCDYDSKGIPGVGKETICKFINELVEIDKKTNKKTNILEIMRKWKQSSYEGIGIKIEDKIRKNVLLNCPMDFPNEQIIQEYLFIDENAKRFLQSEFKANDRWLRPKLNYIQVRQSANL
jgi:5'-3' exonuclease